MTTMEMNFVNSLSNWATFICAVFIIIGSITLLAHISSLWTVIFFAIAWYAGSKGSQRDNQAVNLWLHFLGGAGFWVSLLVCLNV
jgi:hypothetical protein